MAVTYNDNGGSVDGSNKAFTFTFPYLKTEDVKVALNGKTQATTKYAVSTSPTKITFNNTSIDATVQESDGAPKTGVNVRIYRKTDCGAPKAVFAPGSTLRASDINNNQEQALFSAQEMQTQSSMQKMEIELDDDVEIKLGNSDDFTIKYDSVNSDALITAANTVFSAAVNVKGNTDLDGTLNVDGATTLDGTTVDGVLDVNGSATIDNVQINGNEVDTTSGNLTIDSAGGTTTIDDALTVSGTLGVTGTSTLSDVTGAAIVTSGTSTSDTKVYSAKRCDELYFNVDSGESIESGDTWSAADTKIATTKAIDARIIDLVDDAGGFWPIANELSFPNSNPDTNDPPGAGTIVSIKETSNSITTNNSGSVGIQNGSLDGNVVTITGLPASTTYPVGTGMLVETTSTLHTYSFHRLVPKATEVSTVASNISNVNTCATNISAIIAAPTQATNAASSATAAANSATAAASSATAAAASESTVNTSATNAATSATNAAASATTASTQATTATTKATEAATSATNAANSATTATTQATTATTQATTATTQASNASTSATNAASSATSAATSATTATTQASTATTQASTATTQASVATTKASNAGASATSAATSATTASTHASTAATHAATALAYRNATAGIQITEASNAYNLSDSVSSHTAWGDVTDTGSAVFLGEVGNTLLSMSAGTASYNYGAIT